MEDINYINSFDHQRNLLYSIKEKCLQCSNDELIKYLNFISEMLNKFSLPFAFIVIESGLSSAIVNFYFFEEINIRIPSNIIICKLVDIFNFEMSSENPTNHLTEIAKNSNYSHRNIKTKTEELFDILNGIKNNMEMILGMQEPEVIKDSIDPINQRLNEFMVIMNLNIKNLSPLEVQFFEYLYIGIMKMKKEGEEQMLKYNKVMDINEDSSDNNIINNNDCENNNNNNNKFIDINKLPLVKQSSDIKTYRSNIELKKRSFLYYNEYLNEGEGIEIEYKHYQFPLQIMHKEELKKQICSFLNARGGRIYLGITDTKQVKGILLKNKLRENTRSEILNLTYDFYPNCRTSNIIIHFIPIKDYPKETIISNLYVIKIIIIQGDTSRLYSISNIGYQSFLRAPGQCMNLKAEEIAQEIMRRGNQPENPISKDEFKDEEPNIPDELEEEDNDEINEQNCEKEIHLKRKKGNSKYYSVKVTNISMKATASQLEDMFKDYGPISLKFFPNKKATKLYGFLTFSSKGSAENCVKFFNGYLLYGMGLKLHIK